MFQDLDQTLQTLLDDPVAPSTVRVAEKRFETPEKDFKPDQTGDSALNLFLFEVKENRGLRDSSPDWKNVGGQLVANRGPIRVLCSYMVTAWATGVGPAKVTKEHHLLGDAFAWLTGFGTIPRNYFRGQMPLTQPPELPPPMMVAQLEGNKVFGEFWTALGSAPRPAFLLQVTISMPLPDQPPTPPVTTILANYGQRVAGQESLVAGEEWIAIAGTVRTKRGVPAGNPPISVAAAAVVIEPAGVGVATDSNGRFFFPMVRRELGQTLRTRAKQLGEQVQKIDVPSDNGEYDITFS